MLMPQGAFIKSNIINKLKILFPGRAHNVEAFGPVSTIMPYRNMDDAI